VRTVTGIVGYFCANIGAESVEILEKHKRSVISYKIYSARANFVINAIGGAKKRSFYLNTIFLHSLKMSSMWCKL